MKLALIIQNYRWPLFSLFTCFMAYGLLIPWLGFYWDDWQYIFPIISNRLSDLHLIFSNNRPYSYWSIAIVSPFLGSSPFRWQLFALLLRWTSSLALYWSLSFLWPTKKTINWLIAIFFSVYPIFFWQFSSVTFSQHFMSATLFFLSMGVMAWGAVNEKYLSLATLIGLSSSLLHMITVEYFLGLELLRPIFLFWILVRVKGPSTNTLLKTARLWIPYLVVQSGFAYWRIFVANLERNEFALGAQNLALSSIANSYMHLLWDSWVKAVNVVIVNLPQRFSLFSVGIGTLVFVLFATYVSKAVEYDHSSNNDRNLVKQRFAFGILAILFGLLPVWAIGKSLFSVGMAADRYAIPALLGASILLVSFVSIISPTKKIFVFLIGLLLFVSVVNQLENGNLFRKSWAAQEKFYSQLQWRAPDIAPHTALFSYGVFAGRMNENTSGFALNSLYPQSSNAKELDYWIYDFEIGPSEWDFSSWEGNELLGNSAGLSAPAVFPEEVLLFFIPDSGCLWLLTPLDQYNNYIPSELRDLAAYSNIDRIFPMSREINQPEFPGGNINNPDSWCFYYQKAALAQQMGQWEEIEALMESAFRKEVSPNNEIEFIPLIEAHVRLGNAKRALEISNFEGNHIKARVLICALWGRLISDPDVDLPANIIVEILLRPECEFIQSEFQ